MWILIKMNKTYSQILLKIIFYNKCSKIKKNKMIIIYLKIIKIKIGKINKIKLVMKKTISKTYFKIKKIVFWKIKNN